MKKLVAGIFALGLLLPGVSFAVDCDVYHEAISACAAADGCNTTIDDFSTCLVEEQGITDKAEDGTNEVKEVVHCFKTQYSCE